MRTVYVDSNHICHAETAEGRTAVEVDCLDNVSEIGLECYKLIQCGDHNFVQCVNSSAEPFANRQSEYDLQIQAQLMDDIEELCNELIGE